MSESKYKYTGVYKFAESLKNFAISIKLIKYGTNKILEEKSFDTGEHYDSNYGDKIVIKWQEKIFCKKEELYYRSTETFDTFIAREYHKKILEEKFSKPKEIPIYTLTDADIITGKFSHFSYSMNNSQRFMYIMLEKEESNSDIVLCKIEADIKKNMLLITPDFNHLNNRTYTIKDSNGRPNYLYTISDGSIQLSKSDYLLKKEIESRIHSNHLRRQKSISQMHNEFFKDNNNVKYHIFIEIMSATHFPKSNLFIEYWLKLPKNCLTTDNKMELEGRTQSCHCDANRNANFGHLIDFNWMQVDEGENDYGEDKGLKLMPKMFIKVGGYNLLGSEVTEGYGIIQLPNTPGSHAIQVNTWRPISRKFSISNYITASSSDITLLNEYQDPKQTANFASESTGLVNIRINVIIESIIQSSEAKRDIDFKPFITNIAEVLSAFQLAKQKMMNIKALKDNE